MQEPLSADQTITVRREWFAFLLHCLAQKATLEELAAEYPDGAIADVVKRRQPLAMAAWMDGTLILNGVETTEWQSPMPPL